LKKYSDVSAREHRGCGLSVCRPPAYGLSSDRLFGGPYSADGIEETASQGPQVEPLFGIRQRVASGPEEPRSSEGIFDGEGFAIAASR
jgi:hypothetical protein